MEYRKSYKVCYIRNVTAKLSVLIAEHEFSYMSFVMRVDLDINIKYFSYASTKSINTSFTTVRTYILPTFSVESKSVSCNI